MICSLPLFASSAYMAPSGAAPQQVRAGSVSMDISKPSKAMPFLTAPVAMSSGLVGAEAGFDPLYFSDFLDIKWLREAELKHGRICMLAATGGPRADRRVHGLVRDNLQQGQDYHDGHV